MVVISRSRAPCARSLRKLTPVSRKVKNRTTTPRTVQHGVLVDQAKSYERHDNERSRNSEPDGALSFMTCLACLVEGASPRTRIEPEFSFNIPTRIRIKVVLPGPLSPSIPNISPRLTVRVSVFKISREP